MNCDATQKEKSKDTGLSSPSDKEKTTKRLLIGISLVWIFIIGGSIAWGWFFLNQSLMTVAESEASLSFDKDVVYRRWVTMHGGVYVPPTEKTPPNPYLAHLPERDVVTTDGKQLTLVNPAYMTRQVHELGLEQYGLRGHITSLNPLRPENKPDAWEAEALKAFEKGESQVMSVEMLDGQPYLRLMRPFITETDCLKCHGHQGYREGDIRGGISFSAPLAVYAAETAKQQMHMVLGYAAVGLLGLLGLWMSGKIILRSDRKAREREELFKSLFMKSPVSIIIHDTNTGDIVNANPRAWTAYGYSSLDELKPNDFWIEPPYSFEDALRLIRKADQEGSRRFEWLNRRKTGEYFWEDVHLGPILINGKKRIMAVSIDITERKRAEESLHEHEALKHLLMDLATRCINVSLEMIDQAINEILEKIGKFTQADRLYIFRHDHAKQTFSNIHEWCAQGISPVIDNNQAIPFEFFRDMLDLFEKGNIVHIPYVDRMREDHKMRAIFLQHDIKSLIMVPMLQDGISIGFVGFDSVKNTRKFTENEINILKVLAGVISSVLARQQAEETIRRTSLKLREMAMTDELTGLSNRRFFFTQGEKEIERAKRFKTPVSLLMVDLDNFKKINDTLGHQAGDKVLQSVASVFADNIRQIDILGRIGGEEFCVFLPNTSRKDATVLAERLRLEVEQTTCLVQGLPVNVTVSIGLVSSNGDALILDSLLSRADVAMYQAKSKGRNRIVIASG